MVVAIIATNLGALVVLPAIIKLARLDIIESDEAALSWKFRVMNKLRLGYKNVKVLTTLIVNGNAIDK